MFQSFDTNASSTHSAERVAGLGERLRAQGATGFLLPRSDAHQGETVAPRDERLAWLTGFTGSAGVAIVYHDRGALFVDGRYTLQAARQIDQQIFEVVPSHVTSPADWIAANLTRTDVLAYDPWLHGGDEIERLSKAVEAVGARLQALDANPIDEIWSDQPPPPSGAVRIQPDELSGEPNHEKRARIGADLADRSIDAAILTLPDSIAWLLNIRGGDLARSPVALGFAILAADGGVDLFMEPDKFDGAVREHLGNHVRIAPPEALQETLQSLSGRTVLVDSATCPVWITNRLDQAGATLEQGRDPCIAPKAIKNETELNGMRAAHHRDGVAFVRFLAALARRLDADETLTEIAIVKQLEAARTATGDLVDISFDTICGSGPNGAIVHYRVSHETNRTLVPGEILLIDSGGQYPDGTTDITRTLSTGPVPEGVRRPFTLVLKGMIAISEARWPAGLTGRDLDPLARQALWAAGYDYDHGTGHGVGCHLNVHEGPQSLSRRGDKAALEPGMILSNEPGYYREGEFGIRIENLVIVREASTPEGGDRPMLRFETLTFAPIDRALIDPALMTDAEVAWINTYHAKVLQKLGPDLPDEDRAWLSGACEPIYR